MKYFSKHIFDGTIQQIENVNDSVYGYENRGKHQQPLQEIRNHLSETGFKPTARFAHTKILSVKNKKFEMLIMLSI